MGLKDVFVVFGFSMILTIAGCVNRWESSFEAAGGVGLAPLSGQSVPQIRRVPWERLDETLYGLEREVIESDVHPSEWPGWKLRERDERLLQALQVSEPPERALILGRSVFRSTDPVSPSDGQLESFAAEIGADYAVWSSRYEGQRDVVVEEPVTTSGYSFGHGFGHRGRFGSSYFTGTAYVPVVVRADEYAWLVYYVRILPP